jgi:antitoxin MazE
MNRTVLYKVARVCSLLSATRQRRVVLARLNALSTVHSKSAPGKALPAEYRGGNDAGFQMGNSLAVRLPKALVDELGLKEGDEIIVVAARDRTIEIEPRGARRKAALARMAERNWTLPADYNSIATRQTSGEAFFSA